MPRPFYAVSGYDRARQVRVTDQPNPGDLYGVSKCFGEALGRYLGEQEGISTVAIRIGAWRKDDDFTNLSLEDATGSLDAFISARDLNQLFVRCIETAPLTFAIAHGLSGDRFGRMDLLDTKATFGYKPQDDLTRQVGSLYPLLGPNRHAFHSVRDEWEKSGMREQLTDPAEQMSTD